MLPEDVGNSAISLPRDRTQKLNDRDLLSVAESGQLLCSLKDVHQARSIRERYRNRASGYHAGESLQLRYKSMNVDRHAADELMPRMGLRKRPRRKKDMLHADIVVSISAG